MCGIVALFSRQEPISETSLKRGIDSLYHRGPDAQKIWISDDGRVGLGHRRLSIIDLTSGDQPISNQDDTLHIIANGEFYDFERIQQDLKQKGYNLRTHSDSEIAIHLYNEFGTQCLHHLRGEFAFVIWDERNQTLFAARDRFGIKPLYYTMHGDTLYLALGRYWFVAIGASLLLGFLLSAPITITLIIKFAVDPFTFPGNVILCA
jgi:asparagine synthase (glutamine-hydrolysing)